MKHSRFLVLLSLCVAAATGVAAAAGFENRFQPMGIDGAGGPTPIKKPRWTLQDFEDVAAANRTSGAAFGAPEVNAIVLFSQCRALTSTLYPSLAASESDAVVGDTPFAFVSPLPGLSSVCFNPQNENNIVINPLNASNLVTSANEYRGNVHVAYVSFDRGGSWRNVVLPGWTRDSGGQGQFSNLDSCGDPVLAFAPDGSRVYYAGLVCNFSGPGNYQLRSGIAVAWSSDGGVSWSAPTMVHYTASGNFFHDKQWMTIAADGTVHVTWTWFRQTPNGKFGESPIYIASSNGSGGFGGPRQVSDALHPFNQGSNVGVAPNGTIYVSYIASTAETNFDSSALVLARSTDGGNNWTNVQGSRIYDDTNCYPRQLPGTGQGRQTLTGANFRIHAFPNMAVDAATGRVHIVWTDNRLHPGCGSASPTFDRALGDTQNTVWYVRTDNGSTFTTPTALTSAVADGVFPAIAADRGKVYVGYYTRQYAKLNILATGVPQCRVRGVAVAQPGFPDGTLFTLNYGTSATPKANVCIDYAARQSVDGGASFAAEQRLSSVSSNPWTLFTGAFIGDYTGVALDAAGRGVAVWTDFRGNPGAHASGQITPANQDAIVHVQ
jgi:hypothetical protein